jgi:hypothetical protein
MQPTPLATAFPKLAALIDAERPLISAALLDILVTHIGDDHILAEVTTPHSYDILTSPSQHDYLNRALSKHWDREASVALTLHIPSIPPPPANKRTRTTNALTFTERATLQYWMQQADNEAYVATESDNAAAIKATQDLAEKAITITAGNIASMRKILGIDKVKPAKPAAEPAHNIDLAALQAKVIEHGIQLDPLKDNDLATILSGLRNHLLKLEERIETLESANN